MKQDSCFLNFFIIDYLLIQYKFMYMCDKDMFMCMFCELLCEIMLLMGYEIICNLLIMIKWVEILLVVVDVLVIVGKKFVIVFVLCVGIGMLDGLFDLVLFVCVGYIGVYCVDDYCLVEYLVCLFDLEDCIFILCDLMVVIGYLVVYVVDVFKCCNVLVVNIMFVVLVVVFEGVQVFQDVYLDVKLFVVLFDLYLNEYVYIVLGLGDVGDCLFGIKN